MADAKIFLNYRREDADIWADTVYRALTPRFEVFMDVDGQIPDGLPWAEWLDAQVRSCDALVALIGRRWVEAFDAKAADRAPDFVKREIETALALDIPVVPVLLSDAPMPEMERLPESVRPLFDRQARRIQRGPELDRGLTGLRDGLTASIRLKRDAAKDAAREAARRAGRRTTAADPNGPREVGSSRRALVLGGLALGGGAIAAATFWPRGAEQSTSTEARPRPTPTLTTVEDPTVWRPSEAEIRAAQSELTRLGRYKGAVDGRWGDASQAALRAFQGEAGLSPADGALRKTTLAALRAAPTPAFTGVLRGHTRLVLSVAIAPDGTRALSGSYDNTLKLWDLATGQALRTFEGHTNYVSSVALTPDGTRALSGSRDTTLKLWDLGTGQALRSFEGHTDEVLSVALTPDGPRALSGARDKTLILWDLTSGQALRTFEGHTKWVTSVALTPNGTRAVSGALDRTLKLWDLATGRVLRTFEGHTGGVLSVALTPDGTRALSGSLDRTLKLWDLASGRALRSFEGHTNWVSSVALAPDGTRALSGAGDKTLKLWDLATGQALRSFDGHTRPVFSVAVTPDGTRAICGSTDRTLILWDLATGQALRTLTGHTGSVLSVAIAPDGTRALSGSWDGTVRVWDLTG